MSKSIVAALFVAMLFGSTTAVDAGMWKIFLRSQGMHMGQGYHVKMMQRYDQRMQRGTHSWSHGGHVYPGMGPSVPFGGHMTPNDGSTPPYEVMEPGYTETLPSDARPSQPVPMNSASPEPTRLVPVPLPPQANSILVPRSAMTSGRTWQATQQPTSRYPATPYPATPQPGIQRLHSPGIPTPLREYPVERYPSFR